jgi:hypothetical protein
VVYQVGLQPILDAAERFKSQLGAYGVQEVWVVGGTSKSKRWFQPDLKNAFGAVKVVFPAFATRSNISPFEPR